MPDISAVLWDLGGVVVDYDHNKINRRLSLDSGMNLKEVSTALLRRSGSGYQGLLKPYNTGQIDSLEFYRSLQTSVGLRMSYDEFVEAWTDVFIVHQPILDCLQFLRSRMIPQAILSSTNLLHLEKIVTLTHLDDLIGRDHFVTTFSVGVEKPDKKLFETASTCLDLPLKRCVYVDDIKPYIDAGLSYGLGAGIHMDASLPDYQEQCITTLRSLLFDKK